MAAKVMLSRTFRLNFLVLCRVRTPDQVNRVAVSWNQFPRFSSSSSDNVAAEGATEYSELEEDEEELERRRDISGLPKKLRNRMSHVMNPPDQDSVGYRPEHKLTELRRMSYAKYGLASGVNPGEMWPTREELTEIVEEEQEFEPSLQELWATAAAKRQATLDKRKDRMERVESGMSRMPEYLEKYRQRLHKHQAAEHQGEQRRKEMILEAREYFGYNIDPSDPRFEEMMERKEEEKKKEKKKQKKLEKAARTAGFVSSQSTAGKTGS